MNIKIIGAGSIGNHLAHACRHLGWNVTICDIDDEALSRTKNLIYPGRYEKWDDEIELRNINNVKEKNFDLVLIGTPPNTHLEIAIKEVKDSKPRGILIEKPLCTPDLNCLQEFIRIKEQSKIKFFIGYDHILSQSLENFLKHLREGIIGKIISLEVNFRENWEGIFKAHSWLSGPEDSYLGFSSKGGGALCEHSHALSMWIYLSKCFGFGDIVEVSGNQKFYDQNGLIYDEISALTVKTQNGFLGRVVQDVFTKPVQKEISVFGLKGTASLRFATNDNFDRYNINVSEGKVIRKQFEKKRPDDFINEMKHIDYCLNNNNFVSPIDVDHGIETMNIISKAFLSNDMKQTIKLT